MILYTTWLDIRQCTIITPIPILSDPESGTAKYNSCRVALYVYMYVRVEKLCMSELNVCRYGHFIRQSIVFIRSIYIVVISYSLTYSTLTHFPISL